MKAFIGLGNPGTEYENTRHNVGFRVVDALAEKLGIVFSPSEKMFSHIAKNEAVVLVKPQTFMNDSGKAVVAVSQFYKLEPGQLFVVHDDLDIPLGAYKFQMATGPKVHNGLLSIYEQLGTEEFYHGRIGIDGRSPDSRIPGKEYVLQRFLPEEEKLLEQAIEEIVQTLLQYSQ